MVNQSQAAFGKVRSSLKELPVAEVAEGVVQAALGGKVSILTSDTGSGKTLYATTRLADELDGQVVVLVPQRFLAINAAESIAEIGGLAVGNEVGFAVGSRGGDESKFSKDTKLLLTTYGYAISSGLIQRAKNIVLDEVHEAGLDTSFAKALLRQRLEKGEDLKIVEMSATMDAQRAADYWTGVADTEVFKASGRTFACENRHVKPSQKSLAQTVVDLVEQDGRQGIVVFRPGKGEIEETVKHLQYAVQNVGLTNVEIASIHGEMDSKQRDAAMKAPASGNVKILVGTNVIESGVNIPWLDAGVSDGTGKINHYRDSGAKALVLSDLPQWRITQQEGRVKRFRPGIFVLHSQTAFEDRTERTIPEIERAPLEGVLLECYARGLRPSDLKFDADLSQERLNKAEQRLEFLGLVKNQAITDAGKFVQRLAVGPETGAMLWEAKNSGCLKDAIELAAVLETGNLRADWQKGHGQDRTSDVLDGLKALRA